MLRPPYWVGLDPVPNFFDPTPSGVRMPVAVTTPTKHIGEADVQTATQPVSPPHSAGPLEPLVDHEIAQLAYAHWEGRDRPFGTPLEDWLRAEREIRKIQRERTGLTNLA